MWGHFIDVPQEIVDAIYEDNNRRIVCTFPNGEVGHIALMHKGDGTFFINVRKALFKKLGLQPGDEIEVDVVKDDSKYGMPMPEEMEELLAMDDEASHYFHALTPGKQRSLLYIIGKPKTSDTRLRKALVIVDFLKLNEGRLDFPALNQAFKDSKY